MIKEFDLTSITELIAAGALKLALKNMMTIYRHTSMTEDVSTWCGDDPPTLVHQRSKFLEYRSVAVCYSVFGDPRVHRGGLVPGAVLCSFLFMNDACA